MNAQEAIALLERKRVSDEEQRLRPAQLLSQGLVGGVNYGMANRAEEKKQLSERKKAISENKFNLWKEKLKDYELTDTMGEPLDAQSLNVVHGYIAENDDLPPTVRLKTIKQEKSGGTGWQWNPKSGKYENTGIPTGTEKNDFINPPKAEKPFDEQMDGYNKKQLMRGLPKAQKEFNDNMTEADILERNIKEALAVVDNIPTGIIGSGKIAVMEAAGSKSPVLSDIQKVKSTLSKMQLMNLQFTKGAISDAEMKFFANSVANGDISVLPKMKTAFEMALQDIEQRRKSARKSFNDTYGELSGGKVDDNDPLGLGL